MRIFIGGASGAIGRPLVTRLLGEGHEVIGLTHSPERARILSKIGAKPAIANVLDAVALRAAVINSQPEIVIEMLTSLPKEYTPESMRAAAELDARVRREGGANLQAAAIEAGVRRYIIQSSSFWYAPGKDLAEENTPFAFEGTPAVAAGTRIYEEIEKRVLQEKRLEGICLRYGFFYGPGTWYAPEGSITQQVMQEKFPIVGQGRGVWNYIHIDDAADATVAALKAPVGVYNINDDQPSESSSWLPAFARWVGAPVPQEISEEEARQKFGPDFVYYATKLRGASNAKAKKHLGFQPRPLEWLLETSIRSKT